MSGHLTTTICPNCGNDKCELYEDHKPVIMGVYTCFECGLHIPPPKVVYMDLDELNKYRNKINKKLQVYELVESKRTWIQRLFGLNVENEDKKLHLLEELPSRTFNGFHFLAKEFTNEFK